MVGGVLAELLVEVGHDFLEGLLVLVHIAVGNVEQHLLGSVDDLLGVLGGVVGERRDLRRRADHLAQRGVTVEHLDVTAPSDKRKRVVAQPQKEAPPAHALQLAGTLEVVGK